MEKSIAVESLQSVLALGPGYCICDSAGNIYQKAKPSEHGYTQLFVLSRDSTVLLEYETAPLQVIEEPMRTESEELIYPVYDIKESFMYGKEASNRKQEIDPGTTLFRTKEAKDQRTSIVEMCITDYGIMDNSIHSTWKS